MRAREAIAHYQAENFAEQTLTLITSEQYEPGMLANALGGTSLFGGRQIFLLDTPSALAEFEEEVLSALAELAESENVFLILEGPLLAGKVKQYQKHAEAVENHGVPHSREERNFALTDALMNRDRRRLWVALQELRLAGSPDEQIIGQLWWQLKNLRLVELTKTANEAGMNEYPYKKAKQSLRNFSNDHEVSAVALSLLEMMHETRTGSVDLDVALEQWVLRL
jgi:DNA polymerase III delta subunit